MSVNSMDILDRLIAFETVSAQSNLALIDYVQDFLTTRGFRVTRLMDPEDPKAGLYAEIGPSGPGILLSAHSDVVPVEGQEWTKPPFRLTAEGDKLYGRGTTDMKGFVAEMLACADRASQMPLKEPLKLVLSYDEEVACRGIARIWDQLTPLLGAPRMAVIGEPTEMKVVLGHKGKRAYRARITGQAGHSALAPQFASALHAATDLVGVLRALQADLAVNGARDMDYGVPYSTVHVGCLSSGTALNIVPDTAEMLFEIRHLTNEDPEDLIQRIRAEADALCRAAQGGNGITIEETSAYPGLATDPDTPAAQTLQSCAGTDFAKVAFGTEAGFFARQNIPSLVCGPGSMDGQGHKPDEYIERSELARCAQTLSRLVETLV